MHHILFKAQRKGDDSDQEPLRRIAGRPHVTPGDVLYYTHHETGPECGEVLAHGNDGCTLRHPKGPVQVSWDRIHGHKSRVPVEMHIEDQGEDGAIVRGRDGKRRYLHGYQPDGTQDMSIDKPERTNHMRKAILLFKGFGLGENSIKNNPKLHLDQAKHRWVKNQQEQAATGEPKDPEDVRGSRHGYGIHNIEPGDHVGFKAGEFESKGHITAAGKDGVHVKDSSGREHRVHYHEITHFHGKQPESTPQEDGKPEPQTVANKQPVPPDQFTAAVWSKQFDTPDITEQDVLKGFPPDTSEKIANAIDRLRGIEQTIVDHRVAGADADAMYDEERSKLHRDILAHIFNPDVVARAKSDQPTFTLLGGRGGSGKSWFRGQVYDPSSCIVLDADEIKQKLPEYEGWNAQQVHEESSDILEKALRICQEQKINVVLDATMKTTKSALKKVNAFKDAGFQIEAHYMHLPRAEAAKRAVARFLGKTQRFVPPAVVLSNTTNEASFDAVKKLADAWSFRDNNVPQGQAPILISESKNSQQPMQKSSMMLLWRTSR